MSRLHLLLVLLCATLLACPTPRGGGRSGDDDDAGDDDDSGDDDDAGDDDDSTGDDDDSTGDDDDSTSGDDDDSTSGDDDDATGNDPGELVVNTSSTALGDTPVGTPVTRSISFVNAGDQALTFTASLTWDGVTVFTLTGGDSVNVPLAGGASTSRVLTYTPDEIEANFTSLVVTHTGGNPSPVVLYFEGTGGGVATESSCSNGLDDDGDGFFDCDDWDCVGESVCGDPCCGSMPWPGSNTMCQDASTLACLCAVDPYCCTQGWNSFCSDIYIGADGSCPGAAGCPGPG